MNKIRNKYQKRNYNWSTGKDPKLNGNDKYSDTKDNTNKNDNYKNEDIINNTKGKIGNHLNKNSYEITKTIDIAYKRKHNRNNCKSMDSNIIKKDESLKFSENDNSNNLDKEKIRYKYREKYKDNEEDESRRIKINEEENSKYKPKKYRNMSNDYISSSNRSLKNKYDQNEDNEYVENNIEKDYDDNKLNNNFDQQNYYKKNRENESSYTHSKKNNFRTDNRKMNNKIYEENEKPYNKKYNEKFELKDNKIFNGESSNNSESKFDNQKSINNTNNNKKKKGFRYKSMDKGLEENRLKRALKEIERVNAERFLSGNMVEYFNKVLEDNYDFKEDIFFRNLLNTDKKIGDMDNKYMKPISHIFKEVETKEILNNNEKADDIMKKYINRAKLIGDDDE